MQPRYLTAEEAADRLEISRATLYAYVSRGLIRSEATAGSKRTRRYLAEDIDKLKARKEARRDPAKLTEAALHWGAPLLESALTLIAEGRFYYRGREVLALAEQYTLEQVAGLIWTGELSEQPPEIFASTAADLPARYQALLQDELSDLSPMEAFQVLLPLAASEDITGYDLRPSAVVQTSARILYLLTAIAVQSPVSDAGIAPTLQRAWASAEPEAVSLFNTALILCADHELNVSSFTARCTASAGSTPYGVVTAGLAALHGAKHGGFTERVEALFREVGTPQAAHAALASRLKRGEEIPGFGQRLYPEGDPRGRALLDGVVAAYPDSPEVALASQLVAEATGLIGDYPTIDFGLVTLARTLRLPPGAALALFALGRTVGWLGHAIEQYQTDQLIRPRARYVGPVP